MRKKKSGDSTESIAGKILPTSEQRRLYARARELVDRPLTQDTVAELLDVRHKMSQLVDHRRPSSVEYPFPDITDPMFATHLASLRQFAPSDSLHRAPTHARDIDAAWSSTCRPTVFSLTRPQVFLRNFISPTTPYNGALVFHGVGVGKTCTAVSIAEQFPDRRVWVLAPPALQTSFERTVFDASRLRLDESGSLDLEFAANQCTGSRYLEESRATARSNITDVARRIRRLVASRYTFIGTVAFSSMIREMLAQPDGAHKVHVRFSGSVIIVDEAHHLRTVSDDADKPVADAVRSVVTLADNAKLLLLTATPMFNDARDIVELINLLRINDKRPPVRVSDIFDRKGTLRDARTLTEASRGYVSYVRGDDPFAFPMRIGPSINDGKSTSVSLPTHDAKGVRIPVGERLSETEIMGTALSKEHHQLYDMLERDVASVEGLSGDDENDDDHEAVGEINTRGVSAVQTLLGAGNVVYPAPDFDAHRDGAKHFYGEAGFTSTFETLKRGGISSKRTAQLKYRDTSMPFLGPAHIAKYAAKVSRIIDIITKSRGVVFVYSRFVYSGILPMALALEHAGFQRYGQSELLHPSTLQLRGATDPALFTGVRDKGWRYIAITGSQHDLIAWTQSELDAARHDDNANGDVVKVILGSDKAAEGLDLRFVREVHVLEPWFHFNKLEQVIGRAVRHCFSHASLPLSQRNVTVFMHAAMRPGRDAMRETFDVRAYRIAERKLRQIREVETVMISNSIDCLSSSPYPSSATGTRIDIETSQGTRVRATFPVPVAKHATTSTKCATPPPPKTNKETSSSYDAPRHVSGIHICKSAFRRMFQTAPEAPDGNGGAFHAFTFQQVVDACRLELPTASLDAIIVAIQETLDEKLPFNMIDGTRGYITYVSDIYVFQPLAAPDERIPLRQRAPIPMLQDAHLRHPPAPAHVRVMLKNTSTSSRRRGRRGHDSHSTESDVTRTDTRVRSMRERNVRTIVETIDRGIHDTSARLGLGPTLLTRYPVLRRALLDHLVDRMSSTDIREIVRHTMMRSASLPLRHSESRLTDEVLDSLQRSHVVQWEDEKDRGDLRRTAVVVDFATASNLAFRIFKLADDGSLSIENAQGSQISSIRHRLEETHRSVKDKRIVAYLSRSDAGLRRVHKSSSASSSQAPPKGNVTFKLVGDARGASGSVCVETSTITVEFLRTRITDILPSYMSGYESRLRHVKKNWLCTVYEVMLRAFRPGEFARPVTTRVLNLVNRAKRRYVNP